MEELPTPLEYIFAMAAVDTAIKAVILKGFEFFIHEPVILLSD